MPNSSSTDIFAGGGQTYDAGVQQLNATQARTTPVDPMTGLPPATEPTGGTSTPAVVTTKPAAEAITSATTKLSDLTNPNSSYYQNNPYLLRPGETQAAYFARVPGSQPGSTTTGAPRPGIDQTGEVKGAADTKDPGTSGTDAGTSSAGGKDLIPGTDQLSTGNASVDAQIALHYANVKTYQGDVQNVQTLMDQVRAGTYINPATQNLINSISAKYDALIAQQTDINNRLMASYTQMGIRSGRSMYAPEIEAGNLNKVMSEGLAKIAHINAQKENAIAMATIAGQKNDFAALQKQMDNYNKMEENEIKAAADLQKQASDAVKQAQDQQKINETERMNQQKMDIAQQKQDATDLQNSAYTVLSYLDSLGTRGGSTMEEDLRAVQEYASAHGLDADKLLSQVEQLKMTKDKYGSGPQGEYAFYSDQTKQSGGTPMSFQDFQRTVLHTPKTTTPKPQAPSGLTKSEYSKLKDAGVDSDMADKITTAILSGYSVDEIRKAMGNDAKYLDIYDRAVGIQRILKNKPTTSSGFK